jgi:hypothetical protein
VSTERTYVERVLARALDAPDAELLRDARHALTGRAFVALVSRLAPAR